MLDQRLERSDLLPVHPHILELQTGRVLHNARLADAAEAAIPEGNAAYRPVRQTLGVQHPARFARRHALDHHIAEFGPEGTFRAFLVIEIDGDCGAPDLADLDVAIVEVLEQPATQ